MFLYTDTAFFHFALGNAHLLWKYMKRRAGKELPGSEHWDSLVQSLTCMLSTVLLYFYSDKNLLNYFEATQPQSQLCHVHPLLLFFLFSFFFGGKNKHQIKLQAFAYNDEQYLWSGAFYSCRVIIINRVRSLHITQRLIGNQTEIKWPPKTRPSVLPESATQ